MEYLPPTRPPIRSLLILSTAYVAPRGADPFYEVVVAPDRDRGVSKLITWTRDPELYRRAVAVEGTDARVVVTLGSPVASRFHSRRELLGLICP